MTSQGIMCLNFKAYYIGYVGLIVSVNTPLHYLVSRFSGVHRPVDKTKTRQTIEPWTECSKTMCVCLYCMCETLVFSCSTFDWFPVLALMSSTIVYFLTLHDPSNSWAFYLCQHRGTQSDTHSENRQSLHIITGPLNSFSISPSPLQKCHFKCRTTALFT